MAINKYGNVLVITPTILSNFEKLERCIRSVENQRTTDNIIQHLIVYDGYEKDIPPDAYKYNDLYLDIVATDQERSDTWGAYPRQFGLDILFDVSGSMLFDFVLFLDDDNYLFPEYVGEMMDSMIQNNTDAAICKIYHHGPVNVGYHKNKIQVNTEEDVVCVISGNPPELYNIDTLNIMFSTHVWKDKKWVVNKGIDGYLNDGNTYKEVLKDLNISYVDKILAIHY